MNKTILICGLLLIGFALLGGCHTYDNAYLAADYNYAYPANSYMYYPYYYPYPYMRRPAYYPTYYAYPAYYPPYPYYPYYPYYYPYFGVGFGFSTVIINGGSSGNSMRGTQGFRGGVPSGGRTYRR